MVISNGGPNNASLSLMLLSAAVGVILSLIILACTGVYYLVLRLINGKQVEARRWKKQLNFHKRQMDY